VKVSPFPPWLVTVATARSALRAFNDNLRTACKPGITSAPLPTAILYVGVSASPMPESSPPMAPAPEMTIASFGSATRHITLPFQVRGVVVYKVGNTPREIANAASRFLGEDDQTMASTVDQVFSGHLRSILGGLTMEEIIRDRARLASETRSSSAEEMETLGLKIDSLQIQEVDDPSGYIQNLAAPHQAAVERDARIAAAEANRAATEKEQAAAAAAARAVADSEIAQAQVKAQADTARAQAQQAGPLAQAQAQKQVVVEQTEVAKFEAARREMELQTETVKPAEAARDARIAAAEAKARETELDAGANAKRVEIEASANAKKVEIEAAAQANATERTGLATTAATRATGEAEAAATAAKLTAEADVIEKRATALEKNNEAVIAQTLAEKSPELVRAAAESFRASTTSRC
jgi:hypothetical protein